VEDEETKLQSIWASEIEVLERKLSYWAGRGLASKPQFRQAVERKQLLQRELELSKRRQAMRGSPNLAEGSAASARDSQPRRNLPIANPETARRRRIVAQYQGLSSQKLCGHFDEERIPLPSGWENGLTNPTWAEAYKKKKLLRARIQRIISTDRGAG
jgi:hypothetical protein